MMQSEIDAKDFRICFLKILYIMSKDM